MGEHNTCGPCSSVAQQKGSIVVLCVIEDMHDVTHKPLLLVDCPASCDSMSHAWVPCCWLLPAWLLRSKSWLDVLYLNPVLLCLPAVHMCVCVSLHGQMLQAFRQRLLAQTAAGSFLRSADPNHRISNAAKQLAVRLSPNKDADSTQVCARSAHTRIHVAPGLVGGMHGRACLPLLYVVCVTHAASPAGQVGSWLLCADCCSRQSQTVCARTHPASVPTPPHLVSTLRCTTRSSS